MAAHVEPTRRTAGTRINERTEQLVASVMEATIDELSRSGYDGFRVEAVATAAGVNKTSVYRRWPTKLDLIAAAMRDRVTDLALPDTGTLRGDLLKLIAMLHDRYSGPFYRGMLQVMVGAHADADFMALVRELRNRNLRHYAQLIERAVTRGELPSDTDGELVIELILNPIGTRILKLQQPVTPQTASKIIEIVLRGAEAR